MDIKRYRDGFGEAVRYPFQSVGRVTGLLVTSLIIYVITILSVYPTYATQLIGAGWWYIDDVVVTMSMYTLSMTGWTGMVLTVLYAFLGGVALVNIVSQLSILGVRSITGVSSLAPGLLASGCASCGVGLLGFAGLSGVLALLPFNGNLLRLAGVVLIVFFLASSGNPAVCAVDVEDV